MNGPVTINALPPELLDSTFSFLESSTVPVARLQSSPTNVLRSRASQPLKAASLVCKRWRETAIPQLFRRVVWRVDRHSLQRLEAEKDRSGAIPPLRFVREHELIPYVDSFTIVVGDQARLKTGSSDIILSDFAPEKHLTYDTDMNWLWAAVLEDIDPLRLTLVASPKTLAWLFSRTVFLADEWCFNVSHHIISMSRDHREPPGTIAPAIQDSSDSGSDTTTTISSHSSHTSHSTGSSHLSRRAIRRTPCNLFTMKPWNSVLLNEGSNLEVYRIYEYTMKRPPSILGALLGCEEHPNNLPLLPHSVRNLSYICTAPVSGHWNVIIRALPNLDRFFFRVSTPRPRRFGSGMEPMEALFGRNDLYLSLMRAVFGNRRSNRNSSINWRYLKEIESGDTDDENAMQLMENTMAAQRVRRGWSIARPGLFVRDETVPVPLPGEDDDIDPIGSGWSDTDSD